MTHENEKVVSTLKKLIGVLEDGHEGYQTASENLKHPEYSALFLTYSQQRAQFARELESQIRQHGGDEDESSIGKAAMDVIGAVHRGWINLKGALTGGSNDAILNECETGDASAVKAYETALASGLPSDLTHILRTQYDSIQNAHLKVKGLARIES